MFFAQGRIYEMCQIFVLGRSSETPKEVFRRLCEMASCSAITFFDSEKSLIKELERRREKNEVVATDCFILSGMLVTWQDGVELVAYLERYGINVSCVDRSIEKYEWRSVPLCQA